MSIESFCDDKLIYEGRRAYICSDVDESYKVIFVVTEKHSYSLAFIFVFHSLVLPEYYLILLPWMPITRYAYFTNPLLLGVSTLLIN
jgi:hypothetical protein